jgi:hypothetical protein
MRALGLLALVAATGGCDLFSLGSSFGEYCPDKAVGVTVSFSNEQQRVDELIFRVHVDDKMEFTTPAYKRSPSGDKAKLEIDFSNYDAKRFHTIHVVAIGREKGKRLGTDDAMANIGDKCTSVTLSLSSYYQYCAAGTDCDTGVCPANGCCSSSSSCL